VSDEDAAEGRPHAGRRTGQVLFRFLALYVLLYSFPFPLDTTFGLSIPVSEVWDRVIPWLGARVLRLSEQIAIRPNGSGDTTYNYVQILAIATLALVGTLVWSALGPKRRHYRGLARWLAVGVRYYLGFTMLSYGLAKVAKSQFPFPGLARLLQPHGDASPMSLVWTFMGYSTAYNVFAGGVEALAGLLLLFRRTTTLGALLAIGVLSNIVMLNFCYDIPVKLFSLHLLVMALGLAASDGRRLADAFLLNRPAPPAQFEPHFSRRPWNQVAKAAKAVVLAVFLYQVTSTTLSNYRQWGDGRVKPPLHGIYVVERFERDGQVVPAVVTEPERWRHFVVDWEGLVSVQRMDGTFVHYAFKPELASGKAEVGPYDRFAAFGSYLNGQPSQPAPPSSWSIARPEAGVLIMEGDLLGHRLAMTVKARDASDFPLVKRGFHWVNEVPFNW
jgi:hypothetical protein